MMKYIIQKNRNTTVKSIQSGGEICHDQVCGDGFVDADCGCGLQHAQYTNPVWEIVGCLSPDDEDATHYKFGPVDRQMVVPKTDSFDTRATAQAECDARNAP